MRILGWGAAGVAFPPVWPKPVPATERPPFDPEKLFVGRRQRYELTFWWFSKAGECYMSFQRLTGGRGYVALAGGRTAGFVGSLTGRAIFKYRSFMTFDPEEQRLVTQRFEEEQILGERTFRSARIFEHDKQRILHLKPPRHGKNRSRIEKMASPRAVDHLAGFYNWRAGVYGPQIQGRAYRIPTMPSHNTNEILVNFLSLQETEAHRPKAKVDHPFLIDVRLPPKMLLSDKGQILGWTDRTYEPRKWTIKDVMIMGDVRGWLTKTESVPREADIGWLHPAEMMPHPEERR